MYSVQLGLLICILSGVQSFAVNRSTIEPDHNWKFQFPVKAQTAFVESTTGIPMVLNRFTISFWVDDVPSQYLAYFSTPGREIELYYDVRYNRLYFFVNGGYTYCAGCITTGNRKHILVTWSGTADANGVGSIWVNGLRVHTFSGISVGKSIPKGLRVKLGQLHNSDSSYPFRGEFMYFNLYLTYVKTAEEVAKLAKFGSTSDPEAVLPWGDFIGGGNGDVVLYPEYEIFTKSFTSIRCNANNMTVSLARAAFPHLIPSRASLKDPSCRVSWDDDFVNMTTALDDCGTSVAYNSSVATYTNYLVPDIVHPPADSSDSKGTAHAVINRGAVALDETRLYISCNYDLVPHRTIAAYAVASSRYSIEGSGIRDFKFEIKLYHDASYKQAYNDREYPLHADSTERIYAEGSLTSGGENRTEIRIEKCVMTPDADPNYSTQHELIIEGCAADDTVEYHDSPTFLAQRFSFQAFRFNERPTAVVYMHCYIDVCSADVEGTKCKIGWKACDADEAEA